MLKLIKYFVFYFYFRFFIYDFLFCLAGVGREQEKKYIILMFFYIKLVKILDFIDFNKFDFVIKINISL